MAVVACSYLNFDNIELFAMLMTSCERGADDVRLSFFLLIFIADSEFLRLRTCFGVLHLNIN